MSQVMLREIERLKKNLLALGALVEENVQKAVGSISQRKTAPALEVIESDIEVDKAEIVVEEECLKILALHQPVAIDLRFIVAILKINSDLERIGDLAVNIAERAEYLNTQPRVDIPFDFPGMAGKSKAMLRESLDALINLDSDLARKVCADDDEVDAINRAMYDQVSEGISEHPDQVGSLIHLLEVSRHLERIADHATNIAEDVIYMVEGEIVRHRVEQYTKR